MATQRLVGDMRLTAQATVLKGWGKQWRRINGKSQQDLGRAAGYGSEESPKSAAVAISRIESGKTDPTGRHRQRLLDALGHSEIELETEIERTLAVPPRQAPLVRALAGRVYEENDSRRARIIARSNLLNDRVAFQLKNSERSLENARNHFILPFLDTASSIDWKPLLDAQRVELSDGLIVGTFRSQAENQEFEIQSLRKQTQVSILKTLTDTTAGAIAGARLGAGTATGLLAAVSAAATASTGTAIASLSGAAASSATLAWIGGGSLAAGGMGVAGGTAILTGIVALPALLAVGGVLVWKGRKLRREADAEADKRDAAQQALEELEEASQEASLWNETQQVIIQRAELLGQTIQTRYVAPLVLAHATDTVKDHQIKWDTLSQSAQELLTVQLKLLSIILDTRALPVWLGVTTVNEPELTGNQEKSATFSKDWVNESLVLSQLALDNFEDWMRGLSTLDTHS